MAWHRHREKRLKQGKKNQAKNVAAKRSLKTLTKQLLALIKDKKADEATAQLKKVTKAYATSSKRGVLHKKNASRHISRLSAKVNTLLKPAAA